jgi:hypothetical protein
MPSIRCAGNIMRATQYFIIDKNTRPDPSAYTEEDHVTMPGGIPFHASPSI